MKKDVKFSTRMASTDREAIKELAKQSGMSMSDYVTACCLGKQVVVIDGLKEVLKELKSIGRNLNQLVTLAHMGRVTVIDLESVCRAFSELCGAVRMILERKRWYASMRRDNRKGRQYNCTACLIRGHASRYPYQE